MNRPRFHPVNPAFTAPILLWGCERLPLLLGWALACAIVCPTGFQFLILDLIGLVCIPLWFLICRIIARRDPRATQKTLEHISWADYYFVHAPLDDVPDKAKRNRWLRSAVGKIVAAMVS